MSGAAWRQANLQGANFSDANLTKAGLTGLI
ncbi:pentapeptide repeat-containing protein [Microcoleus sp. AR_TQ3_B6]